MHRAPKAGLGAMCAHLPDVCGRLAPSRIARVRRIAAHDEDAADARVQCEHEGEHDGASPSRGEAVLPHVLDQLHPLLLQVAPRPQSKPASTPARSRRAAPGQRTLPR
eukprot:scaffold382_cov380-Prasinococcus_capsulatus_cf.AAC.25